MHAAMLAASVVAFGACGGDGGVRDDELGNLVLDRKPATAIDVETAAKDPAELSRALASPHSAVLAALGPHTVTVQTRTLVEEGGKPAGAGDEHGLSDRAELEVGDGGAFHGVYTNNADYGREATFVPGAGGGKLYLRPRYQKWHGRAPESPDEPAQIRDGYFAAIAATWDLVAPGAELTDRGATTVAGRAGRKIVVHLAPTVREIPRESLSQRRWRETRSITALDGEIVLDADKGVPLAAKLTATVTFSRDGRRFAMKLGLDAAVTKLGAATIAAPAEAEVVATPTRRGEVDERDYLLHGIAPPIKKNQDGTAAKPIVPGSTKADPAKADPKPTKPKPTKPEETRSETSDATKSEPKPKRTKVPPSDAKPPPAATKPKPPTDMKPTPTGVNPPKPETP